MGPIVSEQQRRGSCTVQGSHPDVTLTGTINATASAMVTGITIIGANKKLLLGEVVGLVVESTGCAYRGPWFDSQCLP